MKSNLPKYPLTSSKSQSGVDFVRGIVNQVHSIFQETPQQNDIGIDAQIELIENEYPIGKIIALQIKTGESYYKKGWCIIPVDNHREYWLNYQLPVVGIVCLPDKKTAYWIDIKKYLHNNFGSKQIAYRPNLVNVFSVDNFLRVFIPSIKKTLPSGFNLSESISLFRSKITEESYIGLLVLYRDFSDQKCVWQEFISFFITSPIERIPIILIYILAHIPWHGDIGGINGFYPKFSTECKQFAQEILNCFTKSELKKLLLFIDEKGITRGSVGQNVETIITSIPKSNAILKDIILNDQEPFSIREWSALIIAQNLAIDSIDIIKSIADKSEMVKYAIEILRNQKYFSLYQ
jgi:hypothetical protein